MEKGVEMRGISKAFGSNQANQAVDFYCNAREVVCLLGENGAGKSTLMKILYGQYKADCGEILLSGKSVDIQSPREAIKMGIQMVHQHFMLVPTLTVTDNVMIGKETKNHYFYDRRQARQVVRKLSEEYHLDIPEDKLVGELSVGEQQKVEIIKALYHGAQILILDEPTAVLTPQEVDELFKVISQLKDDGKTVIMITHKLKETMAISDRVYVMRQGKMAGQCLTENTTIDQLSHMMVGHKISKTEKERFYSDKPVVSLAHVSLKNHEKKEVLKDITLEIREKEILGIAGVEGNGQMELIEVLSALNTNWTGSILFNGTSIQGKKTARLLSEGLSCIHADRQTNGIAMELEVPYNFLMGFWQTDEYTTNLGLLNWQKIKMDSRELLEEYDVRPRDIDRKILEFSGGNQQKFVVGREMKRNPHFLIAAHPTRGVDIMGTSFIHEQLMKLKADGAGILLISSDLDELLELSDRIAVLYDGQVMECRQSSAYQMMELGRLMGGRACK